MRIEGHSDERGTRDHALAVGERRANAVRDFLVLQGVPAAQISIISWGKERPAADGASENCAVTMLVPAGASLGTSLGGVALGCSEPGARLALGLGDFASGHLDEILGAAFLAAGVARQGREVEPFMGFDQIDRRAAAARRIGHSKLEQGVDVAAFGVG